LDRLATERKIIGIKLFPGFEQFYPDEETCYPVYDICAKHHLPVLFHSGETMGEEWREAYNHPERIAKAAKAFPNVPMIIAHFSQPHLDSCREVILQQQNVYADISGLAHPEVEQICGKENILSVISDVANQLPEKILFGTDWPICDFSGHLELVNSLHIPQKTRQAILSDNARRVFSL
jgi:predicted TIM-barrel fold metal-dependent hydrolase